MEEFQEKLAKIREKVGNIEPNMKNFKNTALPLARVKKIMKADEDVRVILSLIYLSFKDDKC